jgi:hypothetical protein
MQDFTLTINDSTYNQILTAIGFPVVDQDTINYLLTKDQIKDYVIKPALVEFSTYFPQRQEISIPVSGTNGVAYYNTDISDKAFSMYYYKFSPASTTTGNGGIMNQGSFYANPFYSASQVLSIGGAGSASGYGTPYPRGREQILYQQKFYQKSIETANRVYYAKWDDQNRRLEIKSSLTGSFEIILALINTDVEDIEYNRRQSFIRYCKGALKLQFAEILGLSQTDLPVSIETSDLKDDGKELMEKELEYWREASLFPVMRS